MHGELATCLGFTYSSRHYNTDHLFHNFSWEAVAIPRDDTGVRWVKETGWLRGNHLSLTSHPPTVILKLSDFHIDLYFCLDITLRRVKDQYSWKPPFLFLSWGPSDHAPNSFLCNENNSDSLRIYSMPGIVLCLLHSLSNLLLIIITQLQ